MSSYVRSCGWGVVRLAMGAFFGVAIWVLGSMAVLVLRQQALVYLAVYVPVRWIEWGIIEAFLRPEPFRWSELAFGAHGAARGWRLRGIVLSCVADIPMIVSIGGLPLGRFMC